jgi:hypothetical protein
MTQRFDVGQYQGLKRPEPLACVIAGCDKPATYTTRYGDGWFRLPEPRCSEHTWELGEWLLAHWRAARLEVAPL